MIASKSMGETDAFNTANQKLASQQLFVQQLQAENSPERQKMYALLEDKKLCKQLLAPSLPDEKPDVKALRQYFTQHPINPVGLANNQKAFFNVLEGIEDAFTRQVLALIRQPKQNEDVQTAVVTLLLMQNDWHDFRLALQENSESFFAGVNETTELIRNSQGKHPILFSGRKEDAQKKLDAIGRNDTIKTTGATFITNCATNITMFASLPAHWGFLNPVLAYIKFAKSVNAGHSEVRYFGRQITEHMFDIYQRENANAPHWQLMKQEILDNLPRYQKPWNLFAETGDKMPGAESTVEHGADIGAQHTYALLQNIARIYENTPEARAYLGQIPFQHTWQRLVASQEIHQWAYHAARSADPWHAHLEQVLSSVLNTTGTVDDALPVVGVVLSLIKAAAVRANGLGVQADIRHDQQSNVEFLERHAESMANKYEGANGLKNIQNPMVYHFFEKYWTDRHEYNPRLLAENMVQPVAQSIGQAVFNFLKGFMEGIS